MKNSIGAGLALLFFVSNVSALDVGVAAKAGINGVGLDLSFGLTKNLNLRFLGAAIDIEGEEETVTVGDSGFEGNIDAELDFDYGAGAVLIDWHAFNNSFRFSAGVMKNAGAVDFSGALQSNIVVDGDPLATDDLGDISGEIELADSFQPYLGIGWGRGAGGDGGFSLSLDLGVAMLDTSVDFDARVNSDGTNGYDQGELNALLAKLESDTEDDLDDYEFWPVFAIGVNYAF